MLECLMLAERFGIKMIRMILADDEPVITRGIKKLLNWKTLGIEITGEYEDGRKALEAIIRDKPDIALLDISMPGMSGVEVLKECRAMESSVSIIFISGFQDFEYAKAALQYGAVDYLLKPVIREELLKAVEKAVAGMAQEDETDLADVKDTEGTGSVNYEILVEDEESGYVPIYAEVIYDKEENEQIRKLIHFSLTSFLEEYLYETKRGIVFQKNDKIVIILKGIEDSEIREVVEDIWTESQKATGHTAFFVIGDVVGSMREIPGMFQQCLARSGYLFFADKMPLPVINLHERVFTGRGDSRMLGELRQKLFDAVVSQNDAQMKECARQYGRLILSLSEGKKEDACFYFCSAVRFMEEKWEAHDLPGRKMEMKELLERSRECTGFTEMERMFEAEFGEYLDRIKAVAVNSDKKDILKAKDYIEKHYMDNLSLNVLADEIHMNPYYFSSFFKKNVGENFKDYVNRIRVEHAVPMLISTDMKTYEIAEKVGFGDIRMFNAAFMKIYRETPGSYRKRVRG